MLRLLFQTVVALIFHRNQICHLKIYSAPVEKKKNTTKVAVLGHRSHASLFIVNKDTIDNFRQIGGWRLFGSLPERKAERERGSHADAATRQRGQCAGVNDRWKSAVSVVDPPRSFWRGSNIGVCPVDRLAHATPRRAALRHATPRRAAPRGSLW